MKSEVRPRRIAGAFLLFDMAENKKSFILYCDYAEVFNELSDKDAGQLIKHIFSYVNDENPTTDNQVVKASFIAIKLQLKRDLKRWNDIREKRSFAGKKSAEARQQNSTNSTHVNFVQQTSTKSTVNDNVNVTVNVNDNVSTNVDNYIKEKSKRFIPPTVQEVIEYCRERNNKVDPQRFIDHYESNGWIVGKTKMKNWKAAVRTWEKNNLNNNQNGTKQLTAEEQIRATVERVMYGNQQQNGSVQHSSDEEATWIDVTGF